MRKNTFKLIISLMIFNFVVEATFQIHRHDPEGSAKCLDGSPAALYYQEGKIKDKIIIFFEGGGLCRGDGLSDMLDYCYNRSLTNLGSSTQYPDTRSFDQWSYISNSRDLNPIFYDWTKAFIPYCDGSLHQGSRINPIQYKGKQLYFRGANNTNAHFDYLHERFGLFDLSEIVISGTSAGAMATYLWGNYIYEKAKYPENVLLIPDSGIFILDFPNPYNNKTMEYYTSSTYQLVNTETKMPIPECVERYPRQVECFQAGNLYQFIKPKMFIVQSEYDSWGLIQVIQLRCVYNQPASNLSRCNDTQKVLIEKYKARLVEGLKNFTKVQKHGIWAISCVQHGFLDNLSFNGDSDYRVPAVMGPTINEALASFRNGGTNLNIDESSWPDNAACSGLYPRKALNLQIESIKDKR